MDISEIQNLIVYPPDEDRINELRSCWTAYLEEGPHARITRNKIDDKLVRLDTIIQGIKSGIKALKDSKDNNTYKLNLFTEQHPSIDNAIAAMEVQLYLHLTAMDFLKFYKQDALNEGLQKFKCMIRIFQYGEELGLTAGKHGAGRGNKNKLFELARMITGIEDTKNIRHYYNEYQKFKGDPSYRMVQYNIREIE